MTFSVRKAKADDFKQLVALMIQLNEFMAPIAFEEKRTKDYPKKLKSFVKNILIKNKDSIFFVCVKKDKVLGFILGQLKKHPPVFQNPKYVHIDSFFVLSNYRSKGVGKLLMNSVFKWAKSKKINEISLNPHVRNPDALKVYEKFGFIHTRNVFKKYFRL